MMVEQFTVTVNNITRHIERNRDGVLLWIDGEEVRPLAKNSYDYAYTHGGNTYKQVCEAAWQAAHKRSVAKSRGEILE